MSGNRITVWETIQRIDDVDIPDLRKEISTAIITGSEARKILSERISCMENRIRLLELANSSCPPVDVG